jgi:aspartate racemase
MDGAFRDVHHPEMIIWQATQVPSRSMYYEGRGESFIDDYVTIGKKLKAAGATVLCMCCNTAHNAIEEISDKVQLPFINLIAECVLRAKQTGKKRIGLAAADGCLAGKVYERQFEKLFPEALIVYPSAEMQKEVTRGICNVKNHNRFLPDNHADRPKTIFENVYRHLIDDQKAETVIMGCTDIRVDYCNPNVINSLEVLVDKIFNLIKYGK